MLSTATTHIKPGFGRNRLLQALVAWYAVICVVTSINTVFPEDWLLEYVLALIAVAACGHLPQVPAFRPVHLLIRPS
jgi:hypothetical protein